MCQISLANNCLDSSDVQEVMKDFSFETFNFKAFSAEAQRVHTKSALTKWRALKTPPLCNDDSLAYRSIQAIIHLKNLPPFTSPKDTFDRDVLGERPYLFFKERVKTIRLDTDPESRTCDQKISGTLAYVRDSFSNTMYLCPFSMKFSEFKMNGVLIHEARHLLQSSEYGDEKEDFLRNNDGKKGQLNAHTRCELGFFINTFSCDKTIEASGSYAVEMEFYLKVYRNKLIDSRTRMEAKSLALDGYLGHFNQLPDGETGLIAVSEDGEVIFHNTNTGQNKTLLNNLDEDDIVTNRFSLSVFNPEKGSADNYILQNNFHNTPGTLAEKFRQLSIYEQKKLKDVAYGKKIQCLLFTDSIFCYGKNKDYTIKFPESFNPKQITTLNGGQSQDLFFIVSEDNEHYRIPFEEQLDEINFINLVLTPSLSLFKSALLMPKLQRFAIDTNGVLVNYSNTEELTPVKGLKSIKFKKAFGPYIWSEKLLEL